MSDSELDRLFSEALEEAYTYAPATTAILSTLELRHPSFRNTDGEFAVRFVRDYGTLLEEGVNGSPDIHGHYLKLEDDAPVDGGRTVEFIACMFDFSLPPQQEGTIPEIEISFDNVTGIVMPYLDAAITYKEKMQVTYREYLPDEVGPQFVLDGLQMRRVESDILRVRGSAGFTDLVNKLFPNKIYKPQDFVGLET